MNAIERAKLALDGLSIGDAFGERLMHSPARASAIRDRGAPKGPWSWTDDTAMASSIVDELAAGAGIDPASLAKRFARRYAAEPARGYGSGAHQVLADIAAGVPYERAATKLFGGEGSRGNGGGMRSAPIGAYYCDDLDGATDHAARSAAPTHAHPDGAAGAVAVAIAAACAFAGERDPRALLETVVARTPAGPTRDGVRRAAAMIGADPITVAAELGNGSRVLAADTIPFAVWCAASHLGDYASALWACASVGGDVDTTCAMVGGIIAGAVGLAGIPDAWRASREPL
ncbi:MAG TPA: ADP-ribosylglycohydrolase family protein [Kofleriaceae bacterium]|jgi:ADP-ribosylglycohydrolase